MSQPSARFFCVTERGVPIETGGLLRLACRDRRIAFEEIRPDRFNFSTATPLLPGDLLFRSGCSFAAMRTEQFLFAPGVATFYRDDEDIFFDPANPYLLFDRAQLPLPQHFFCSTRDRTILRSYVDRLGGFPLVAKVEGGSLGVGVMRVDSYPALFSLVDYLVDAGRCPMLMSYIADTLHWRVIVVGDRAVAAYSNPTEPDDFRSLPSTSRADYLATVPDDLATLAVRSLQTIRREFGGVDILRTRDGKVFLLEANFPCYFAQAQAVADIDIAGCMIDRLLAKAESAATRASQDVNRRSENS